MEGEPKEIVLENTGYEVVGDKECEGLEIKGDNEQKMSPEEIMSRIDTNTKTSIARIERGGESRESVNVSLSMVGQAKETLNYFLKTTQEHPTLSLGSLTVLLFALGIANGTNTGNCIVADGRFTVPAMGTAILTALSGLLNARLGD